MKTKFYPLAALLIVALATQSQNAYMIRDLKIGGNTNINYVTVSQNKVFFSANDSVGNQELFSSDGSDTGTVLVRDICPGACSGDPQELFDGGSKLYFHANHPSLGGQLYGSDGTLLGTDTVNTTVTKGGGQFANMNGETFFVGGMFSTTGSELYKTNGTSAGTVLVKDIYPGVTGGMTSSIFVAGNKLFFAGNDLSGYGLFTSDGSVGNATKILSMNFNTAQFSYRGSYNSKFYFSYNDSINGQELWVSDGTIGGTVLLDLNTEVDGSSNPSEITVMNNEVYVVANGGSNIGKELFKTDGTVGGTSLVKDAAPGGDDGVLGDIVAVGNKIYFQGYTSGLNNTELWISNGTSIGTNKLVEIAATQQDITDMASVNNKLVFMLKDNKTDVWGSDGTALGTHLLYATQFNNNLSEMLVSGNRLFFVNKNDSVGKELWASDGTVNGTFLVIDAKPGGDANPQHLVDLNGILIYVCDDGVHNGELWRVDTAQLALNNPNGILEPKNHSRVSVYPNPVNESLQFAISNEQANTEIQLQIFDVAGKLIRDEKTFSNRVDVSELTNGFYILSLNFNGKTQQQRFIVQH